MVENLILQFRNELIPIKKEVRQLTTLAKNLGKHFLTDTFRISHSIDKPENCYKLIHRNDKIKSRVHGIVNRLKQVGAKATKLQNQYEEVLNTLKSYHKESYKLMHNMVNQCIPYNLQKRGDTIRKSIDKEFFNAQYSRKISCDQKNDILYSYYITIPENINIMFVMAVNHSTGQELWTTTEISPRLISPEKVSGIVSNKEIIKGIKNFIVSKGTVELKDPTLLKDNYDKVIVKDSSIILIINNSGDKIKRNSQDKVINANPELFQKAVDDVMNATGLRKDQMKFFTKLKDDSIHIHFNLIEGIK